MTRTLLLWIVMIGGLFAAAPAGAEDLALENWLLQRLTWVEDFDKARGSTFDKQLVFETSGAWTTAAEDGALTFTNDTESSAVRRFTFANLRFADLPWSTPVDGANISATVRIDSGKGGAAGLLVGYPQANYLLFSIGAGHQFRIAEKQSGSLELIETGENDAILAGEHNKLELVQDAGNMTFRVNGAEVYTLTREALADAPVGIAAMGMGRFFFDEVSLIPSRTILTRFKDRCELPEPAENDVIAIAGAYEGAALSTVSIIGQDDVTNVIHIDVSPGAQPIYFIAVADNPTIWNFRGDTARISQVVSIKGGHDNAVAGLPASKVYFEERNCLDGAGANHWPISVTTAALSLGRIVDVAPGASKLASVTLPEGSFVEGEAATATGLPVSADSSLLRDALRLNPGGVAEVDPASVVSRAPVEAYEVLPQLWGLIRLMDAGKVVRVGDAEDHTFKILDAIQLPAGLAGSYAQKFILAYGVPPPTGDLGHSELALEEAPDATGISAE